MGNSENQEKTHYEVSTGRELKEKYGLTAENRPIIKLNPDNIPPELRYLIPLAETWGISDDLIRGDVVKKASIKALQEMRAVMDDVDYDLLYDWLAGPEASDPNVSDEYIAFSCLTMAASLAKIKLDNLNDEK